MITLRGSIGTGFMIACLLAMVTGCATVSTTDSKSDAAAKQFQTEAGMGSIYFCRGTGISGNMLVAQTQLDGQMIGAVAPNTYQMISVAPGHHTVTVSGPTNVENLPVDVAAGNLYFFNVSVDWAGPGIRHRHIEAMSDADGRKAVSGESRAVATTNQ